MNKMHVFFGLAVLLLFSGCLGLEQVTGEEGYGYSKGAVAYPEPALYPMEEDYAGSSYDTGYDYSYAERMVIKSGYISLSVPEGTLDDKVNSARTYAQELGGEITGMNFYESDLSSTYSITVRIRPSNFDSFVEKLKTVGDITSMSTDLDEVTEQYPDLETRVENLEKELERLNSFYEEAEDIEDLLMIEREVTRVTTELEWLYQQKLDIERRVAKSTITVNITEEKSAVDTNLIVPLQQLANIFFGALSAAIMLLAALLGFLLPVAVALGVLYLMVKALWKVGKKGEKKK